MPRQNTIDIQLHDAYVVVDRVSLTVLILGPLMFVIFLIRGVVNRFKSTTTNIGFIIGVILVSMIMYRLIEIQHALSQ
jgi:hypothetical protein